MDSPPPMTETTDPAQAIGGTVGIAFALAVSFLVGAFVMMAGLGLAGLGHLLTGDTGFPVTLLGGLSGTVAFFLFLSYRYYRLE